MRLIGCILAVFSTAGLVGAMDKVLLEDGRIVSGKVTLDDGSAITVHLSICLQGPHQVVSKSTKTRFPSFFVCVSAASRS